MGDLWNSSYSLQQRRFGFWEIAKLLYKPRRCDCVVLKTKPWWTVLKCKPWQLQREWKQTLIAQLGMHWAAIKTKVVANKLIIPLAVCHNGHMGSLWGCIIAASSAALLRGSFVPNFGPCGQRQVPSCWRCASAFALWQLSWGPLSWLSPSLCCWAATHGNRPVKALLQELPATPECKGRPSTHGTTVNKKGSSN